MQPPSGYSPPALGPPPSLLRPPALQAPPVGLPAPGAPPPQPSFLAASVRPAPVAGFAASSAQPSQAPASAAVARSTAAAATAAQPNSGAHSQQVDQRIRELLQHGTLCIVPNIPCTLVLHLPPSQSPDTAQHTKRCDTSQSACRDATRNAPTVMNMTCTHIGRPPPKPRPPPAVPAHAKIRKRTASAAKAAPAAKRVRQGNAAAVLRLFIT